MNGDAIPAKQIGVRVSKLTGKSIVGFREGSTGGSAFRAQNPASGEAVGPDFFSARDEDIAQAVRLAHEAFDSCSRLSGREKGKFLGAIAANIESAAAELIEHCGRETALPKGRLQSELGRTCNQLRLFAQVVEEGSWLMARIDRPDSERKPLPKPDIRSMLRPLGPAAIFGASNFPLAFSVAGGDSASALAAGNPIVVKAHPAHPGTSEMVGRAIQKAVRDCNLPEGMFSLLFDAGNEVGIAVVKNPLIKAVGFTGSQAGGRALMKIAAARPEPIPVYAEMSSTNPLFILPGALRQNAEKLAAGLCTSFTLGAGQFCTKPGMIFVEEGADATKFTTKLQEIVAQATPFQLLTSKIRSSYNSELDARKTKPGVKLIGESKPGHETSVGVALFETSSESFLDNPDLASEIFGPSTLLVKHSRREDVLRIAHELEGHLTATIHGTEQDLRNFSDLVAILEQKVGRLVFNGFPTGVEVSHAMVHGGPFPATSDGRSTSVGTQAIFRFCRPVCYQGFPDPALPEELKDSNPLGIWRMMDGEMTRDAIAQLEISS